MTKILIIDDDPLQVELTCAYLTHAGYQALGAVNPYEGVAVFTRERPDIVLCDLAMPGGGGLAVLDEIQKTSPFTPFVVVSGTNDLTQAVGAIKRGAWDYLLKPLAGYELLAPLFDRLLERAALLRQNAAYQEHLEELVQERTTELVQQLKEKDVLLAEVHHRVKNNLQLLLSLLELEREVPVNGEAQKARDRWERTLRTMALVQEELHSAYEGAAVALQPFLANLIQHTLMEKNWRRDAEFDLRVSPSYETPGRSLALGLVVSMLLVEVVPPKKAWKLEVSLETGKKGKMTLCVVPLGGRWSAQTEARWPPSITNLVTAIGGAFHFEAGKNQVVVVID